MQSGGLLLMSYFLLGQDWAGGSVCIEAASLWKLEKNLS